MDKYKGNKELNTLAREAAKTTKTKGDLEELRKMELK